jgi:6-pyruvoyl-tetrahydropterin synthase
VGQGLPDPKVHFKGRVEQTLTNHQNPNENPEEMSLPDTAVGSQTHRQSPPSPEHRSAVPDAPTVENLGTSTIFLNDITKIDSALFDPGRGIIGQTWRLDVGLTGPLGLNGFVLDFSDFKKMVRKVLKSSLDHALIIPINSQSVVFKGVGRGECWVMRSRNGKGGTEQEWTYVSPPGAVFPSRSVALNRQVLEQEVVRSLRHRLPPDIIHITATLREDDVNPSEAIFRYTHGIAHHSGMCQRLFHGHKSRILCYVGEERRPDYEHYLVRDILGSHVHIATPSQQKSGPQILTGFRGKTKEPVTLAYEATQGYFEATLPADRIFMVEHETSIECITRELAKVVKREENTSEKVKVICHEGIDKGAVAEC